MAKADGVTVPKRRKVGRWLLLMGILLAIPSWTLWLRVSATTHKVWITQSLLYALPYAAILVCVATNSLRPVAFGIATTFCCYGLVSAFLFGAIGVVTMEKTFAAMVVVIPAHFLMTLGMLLLLQRPKGKEVAQWLIGVVAAIAYALTFLALLGTDKRPPFPPTHGF